MEFVRVGLTAAESDAAVHELLSRQRAAGKILLAEQKVCQAAPLSEESTDFATPGGLASTRCSPNPVFSNEAETATDASPFALPQSRRRAEDVSFAEAQHRKASPRTALAEPLLSLKEVRTYVEALHSRADKTVRSLLLSGGLTEKPPFRADGAAVSRQLNQLLWVAGLRREASPGEAGEATLQREDSIPSAMDGRLALEPSAFSRLLMQSGLRVPPESPLMKRLLSLLDEAGEGLLDVELLIAVLERRSAREQDALLAAEEALEDVCHRLAELNVSLDVLSQDLAVASSATLGSCADQPSPHAAAEDAGGSWLSVHSLQRLLRRRLRDGSGRELALAALLLALRSLDANSPSLQSEASALLERIEEVAACTDDDPQSSRKTAGADFAGLEDAASPRRPCLSLVRGSLLLRRVKEARDLLCARKEPSPKKEETSTAPLPLASPPRSPAVVKRDLQQNAGDSPLGQASAYEEALATREKLRFEGASAAAAELSNAFLEREETGGDGDEGSSEESESEAAFDEDHLNDEVEDLRLRSALSMSQSGGVVREETQVPRPPLAALPLLRHLYVRLLLGSLDCRDVAEILFFHQVVSRRREGAAATAASILRREEPRLLRHTSGVHSAVGLWTSLLGAVGALIDEREAAAARDWLLRFAPSPTTPPSPVALRAVSSAVQVSFSALHSLRSSLLPWLAAPASSSAALRRVFFEANSQLGLDVAEEASMEDPERLEDGVVSAARFEKVLLSKLGVSAVDARLATKCLALWGDAFSPSKAVDGSLCRVRLSDVRSEQKRCRSAVLSWVGSGSKVQKILFRLKESPKVPRRPRGELRSPSAASSFSFAWQSTPRLVASNLMSAEDWIQTQVAALSLPPFMFFAALAASSLLRGKGDAFFKDNAVPFGVASRGLAGVLGIPQNLSESLLCFLGARELGRRRVEYFAFRRLSPFLAEAAALATESVQAEGSGKPREATVLRWLKPLLLGGTSASEGQTAGRSFEESVSEAYSNAALREASESREDLQLLLAAAGLPGCVEESVAAEGASWKGPLFTPACRRVGRGVPL